MPSAWLLRASALFSPRSRTLRLRTEMPCSCTALAREKSGLVGGIPKSKESWPKGPGFDYPQRGFALLAVHWLIEITNIKLQITNNFQWPKFENPNNVSPWKVLVIEYWNLRPARSCLAMAGGFIWDLVLGICDFKHKTPRQSHLSLTWPKGPGLLD